MMDLRALVEKAPMATCCGRWSPLPPSGWWSWWSGRFEGPDLQW